MNSDLPKRKHIRLPEYDYSLPGAYFITICTFNKKCILWDEMSAAYEDEKNKCPSGMKLSYQGQIVNEAIKAIPQYYPNVEIGYYVIMPNHIHLILHILDFEGGRMVSAPTVGRIVGQLKRWVSKQIGTSVWQKSFYEHIIRNKQEYDACLKYIYDNPLKWETDDYFC